MIDDRALKLATRPLFSQLSYRLGVAAAMLSLGVILIAIAGRQPDLPARYPIWAQQDTGSEYNTGQVSDDLTEIDEQSIQPEPFVTAQPVLRPAFNATATYSQDISTTRRAQLELGEPLSSGN